MLLFVTRVVVPDKIEFWFITDIINDWKTLTIFVHVNCLRSLACGNESSPLAFVRILGWSTRHYNATTTPLRVCRASATRLVCRASALRSVCRASATRLMCRASATRSVCRASAMREQKNLCANMQSAHMRLVSFILPFKDDR